MTGGAQRDGQGVERACADIAEHDADRGEREEGGTALMAQFAAVGRICARSRGRDLAGRSFHRLNLPGQRRSLRPARAPNLSTMGPHPRRDCLDARRRFESHDELSASAPLVCHCLPGTCAAEWLFPYRSRSPASLSTPQPRPGLDRKSSKTQAFATLSARPSPGAIVADLRRGGIAPSEK